ncbi:alpha-amylase family glycosyl hydrolase [Adhaeribacter radiodurans]|uniref:1,4-alpha-glucan branching enzyme n=1 Tax=Adhaeribacter radiodurans TaxID=2745197 RepID=A0A7L7LCP2_9BACT|nr:alpha-amylase family glycosyl hydrolase [Adhaeribacter radiodurans]QMU30517.1 1,4-alpha-glucan branching enzyme [Adhaeribacter radiodurans]
MYEQFGGLVDNTTQTVTFKLFIPDGERAPHQYAGGGLPRIRQVYVVGSFQDPNHNKWDLNAPILMNSSDYIDDKDVLQGLLYSYTSGQLPPGFYEYKYLVEFENAPSRLISDPCARYGGTENQNSAFVIGGQTEIVQALKSPRLPYQELIVYELMIDDFTANYKTLDEAPFEAIVRKLDELVDLGINAIEFMPWTAWAYADSPGKDFSWGYNPVQYFSVAYKYVNNGSNETNKLVYLKRLINECHKRGIHVIMDGVFNHADALLPSLGFPYYWLYQDPADSPYVGNFEQAAFFKDLDYANRCTLEYIRDACIYWIDTFKIDGIRLDNTLGIYRPGNRGVGLPKLLSELRGHLSRTGNKNFSCILEHSWDYAAIDVTNKVGATSCWLDNFRSNSMSYLGDRPQGFPQIEPSIMRMLHEGKDFDPGRGPTTYIENHDHRRFALKAGGRQYWYLTQPYVIALFTCAGTPLIYNAQEYGEDNDMPEDGHGRVVPRPLDWNKYATEPSPQIFQLYKKLIKIRKDHPGLTSLNFYPNNWEDGWALPNPQGFGIHRDKNVVVYHRWGEDKHNRLERFYVGLNFSDQTQSVTFEVPDQGPWEDLLTGTMVRANNGLLHVDMASNWGFIYYKKY